MTRFYPLLGLLVVLAGCTSLEERQAANGDFDYLEEPQSATLLVPEGLDAPSENNTYTLPTLDEGADEAPVGEQIKVVSPNLVLPLVTGSHVEEGQKQASVFFDQVNDRQPLQQAVWNALIGYLESQRIGVDRFDKAAGVLVTDWIIVENEVDGAWYSWSSTQQSIGRRFEFDLDVKPHGRSAELKVRLAEYMETLGDDVTDQVDPQELRRNEVTMLNNVIGFYHGQTRIADAKRLRELRQGMETEMGFNADGDPAYVVDAEYTMAWTRLLLVLRKLGFNVKDLDQSNGLLFVEYAGQDTGWWDSWFGDDDLPLEETDYRLRVAEQGARTSVTFMDEENQPFSVDLVTKLFPAIQEAMADDALDI